MNLFRTRFRLLGLVLGLGAALAAAPGPLDQVTLQLKWHHQFQFAGYYAAQAKGYYRDAGLEVAIQEGGGGLDTVKEVTSGRAQFGVGNSALLLDRDQGQRLVVLSAVFQHSPLVLMAKAGTGIATVQDLAGKRLMIEHRSDELIAYLRRSGVPESAMTFLNHSFNPEDLIQGRVDCISAYVTDEPFFLRQAGQKFVLFSPLAAGIDFYGDNLFTSEAELAGHPARVRAFRDASMEGWKYAMQHPEEIADLILARYGQRHGRDYLLYEARQMVPLIEPNLVEMGYMYHGRWQHIVDTYTDLGLLPKGFRLQGFLYDPEAEARQNYRRLLRVVAGALVLAGLLGGLALGFLRLNLRLKSESAAREQAEAERAKLEAQLRQTRKMESLGSLAGGVAHDMNNVLGAILGLASANLEAHPPGSPARHALATIIKAAERGGKMVKSLLSFARNSPVEERELDVNALFGDAVQILERTTLAQVRLELDLAPDLRPIRGDAGGLTNALINLCVNAVDAMPRNGILTFRTRNLDRDRIEVQVEDTGTGMAKRVLERALEPFFTTKAEGRGTGLGLTQVYGIVKAHRGQLEIRSEPGQGTCVTMIFPATQPEAGAVPPSCASGPVRAPLHALVVDDDELLRIALQAVLEELGHSVTLAASGEEALGRLEAGLQPDIAILDLNMPGLGGVETLPRLRALRPDLPILLATGRADQTALDLLEAFPRVSLLAKPFSMSDLKERLDPLGAPTP